MWRFALQSDPAARRSSARACSISIASDRQLIDRARVNATREAYSAACIGWADASRHAGLRQARCAARRQGREARRSGAGSHLQARIRARALDGEGRALSSTSPPIRSAASPGGSGRNSAKATTKRRRASIRSTKTSSIRTAAGTARSISAFPMRSTARMSAPARSSWCMAAASRSAASPCTDAGVDEVWRLVTAALDKGQPRFAVQVFPFRLTEAQSRAPKVRSLGRLLGDLKKGYDLFERTACRRSSALRRPLRVRAGTAEHGR